MVSPNRFKERLGSKFMLNPLPHIRLGLLLSLSNFTNVSIVISEKIILIDTLHLVPFNQNATIEKWFLYYIMNLS